MARGSHDLPRPRAWAGGVGPSRCRGRSCPAGSHAALAVAEVRGSSASGDQEPRQSVADETKLMNSFSRSERASGLLALSRRLQGPFKSRLQDRGRQMVEQRGETERVCTGLVTDVLHGIAAQADCTIIALAAGPDAPALRHRSERFRNRYDH